jgi:hypothetical protein
MLILLYPILFYALFFNADCNPLKWLHNLQLKNLYLTAVSLFKRQNLLNLERVRGLSKSRIYVIIWNGEGMHIDLGGKDKPHFIYPKVLFQTLSISASLRGKILTLQVSSDSI